MWMRASCLTTLPRRLAVKIKIRVSVWTVRWYVPTFQRTKAARLTPTITLQQPGRKWKEGLIVTGIHTPSLFTLGRAEPGT